MASIKDIARAANVSYATVSRALRNSPLVNAQTSELIRKIAEEQGYTVSAVARSLVTKRTHTIGVVVTNVADPFVGAVVSGIEEVAQARGIRSCLPVAMRTRTGKSGPYDYRKSAA